MNALGLPVTIHLEDQLIPLPSSFAGPVDGGEGPEGSTSLWRSDTDGDLAKWLNNGFTPRAAGTAAASLAAVVMCSMKAVPDILCRHALLLCIVICLQLSRVMRRFCWSGSDSYCGAWSSLSMHVIQKHSVCIYYLTVTLTLMIGATGFPEEEPQGLQRGGHFSPVRSQSFINNQQRQLLHKLFMKGTSQQQVMPDAGQQGMPYPQQTGYLQQSQQYVPQQQDEQQQQQQQGIFSGQSMLPAFKSGRSDQAAYHINAQAYDSMNYAQQQYGSSQMQGQYQHGVLTRGQSFALANGQPGFLTRGQSFVNGQPGLLARGQSFANGQFSADPGMDGYVESPRLEVLVTPNFSSQELNMLLEVKSVERSYSTTVLAIHL